ncbi:DUF3822 family protein [Albibacterium bauzanense]|uniref:Uncharacterized protein DUF3822 n=1 Tax=Albibacterium bauzanense TaxID=653929 RepID=A0A4R1LZX5_9SPHI|nr:DUF3822 family protein [Albibacterium bauzanense]TCK85158.1 uncharacterized protein DUF3822 [Albibacterium bauzanense]
MESQLELLKAEEKFIQENSLNCKLFIHPKADLSQIAIIDENNTIRLIQEKPTEDFFRGKAGILNLRFLKTYLVVTPESVSLIPLDLYEEDANPSLHLLGEENISKQFSSIIDKQNCLISFSPQEDQKFWLTVLKDVQLIPSSKIMINYLTDMKVKYKTVLGLNFYNDHFEVTLIEDNKLKFYSQFNCATADEFNFFLLTLFDKLDLTPALTQFYLWGDIAEGDENYQRLSKYSQNLSFPSEENLNLIGQKEYSNLNFLIGAIECE